MSFSKLGLGLMSLFSLVGCARRQVDLWPSRVNSALIGRAAAVSASERAEYEAGFTNGAAMVHEALKAGVKPYRPVMNLQGPAPRWRGALPEGVQVEAFTPVPEVDAETGLLLYPASAVTSDAFARGQVDGFSWALSAIGQSLVRPVPVLDFPATWQPFAKQQQGADLDAGKRAVRMLWAPGHLAWAWKERGFPGRRTWRDWDASEPPGWIALSEQALWIETGGQAIALDLESGGILQVRSVLPHAQPRTSSWENHQQDVRREFEAPEFQSALSVLRKAAASGEISDLLAVARRLSGMGEQADGEAFGWYLKAAEKGSPEAMLRVGVLLFHGQATPADRTSARTWLERAVQAGHPDAAAVLKMLFEDSR